MATTDWDEQVAELDRGIRHAVRQVTAEFTTADEALNWASAAERLIVAKARLMELFL